MIKLWKTTFQKSCLVQMIRLVYERVDNILEIGENSDNKLFFSFPKMFSKGSFLSIVNPLPDMPILDSSSSVADKDMMSTRCVCETLMPPETSIL